MTDLVNSMLIIAIATDWRRCLDPDKLKFRVPNRRAPQTITASSGLPPPSCNRKPDRQLTFSTQFHRNDCAFANTKNTSIFFDFFTIVDWTGGHRTGIEPLTSLGIVLGLVSG